jgi:uncharacterized membrane protein
MSTGNVPFRAGAVRPVECLNAGWQLIKSQYWLFLGVSAVAVILGSLVPLGILMGPCMCGIYYCLGRQERGQRVSFDMLFKGFDYFVDSLVATLLMLVPMIVLILPFYFMFFMSVLSSAAAAGPKGPPEGFLAGFFGAFGLLMLFILLVGAVAQIFFFFIYPLIVEQRLSGIEAVKTSFRAAGSNFAGILGLVLLNMLLSIVGVACCYVGAFFVLPITFAAIWKAYTQVFVDSAASASPSNAGESAP